MVIITVERKKTITFFLCFFWCGRNDKTCVQGCCYALTQRIPFKGYLFKSPLKENYNRFFSQTDSSADTQFFPTFLKLPYKHKRNNNGWIVKTFLSLFLKHRPLRADRRPRTQQRPPDRRRRWRHRRRRYRPCRPPSIPPAFMTASPPNANASVPSSLRRTMSWRASGLRPRWAASSGWWCSWWCTRVAASRRRRSKRWRWEARSTNRSCMKQFYNHNSLHAGSENRRRRCGRHAGGGGPWTAGGHGRDRYVHLSGRLRAVHQLQQWPRTHDVAGQYQCTACVQSGPSIVVDR